MEDFLTKYGCAFVIACAAFVGFAALLGVSGGGGAAGGCCFLLLFVAILLALLCGGSEE